MKEQILKIAKNLEQGSISENNAQALLLGLFDVRRSYSLDEVREIALEYRNSCMYGHSHKLTRFELQAELRKIDEKHGLDYKEGVDYNVKGYGVVAD